MLIGLLEKSYDDVGGLSPSGADRPVKETCRGSRGMRSISRSSRGLLFHCIYCGEVSATDHIRSGGAVLCSKDGTKVLH